MPAWRVLTPTHAGRCTHPHQQDAGITRHSHIPLRCEKMLESSSSNHLRDSHPHEQAPVAGALNHELVSGGVVVVHQPVRAGDEVIGCLGLVHTVRQGPPVPPHISTTPAMQSNRCMHMQTMLPLFLSHCAEDIKSSVVLDLFTLCALILTPPHVAPYPPPPPPPPQAQWQTMCLSKCHSCLR